MELIVAIGVILVGVIGAITIAILTITIARESKQRVVAANLAREGIELVRMVRDSNWLAGAAFADGLSESTSQDYSFVWEWDPIAGTWTANFTPDLANFLDEGDDVTTFYRDGVRYLQDATGGTSLPATNFRRIMETNHICADTNECDAGGTPGICNDDDSGSCTTTVGIQVISRVHWSDRGQSKTLNIEEEIHDWR
jgi:Tfp pilus assembly protein PilV